MDSETATPPKPATCPHLGLAIDPSTHRPDPTTDHRCHAGNVPFAVDEERQSYYCLSDIYDLCPRRVLGAPVEILEPTQEAAPGTPEQANPETSRSDAHPVPLKAGAAALAGVVVVAFVLFWSQGQASRPGAAPITAPSAVEVPTASPAPTQPRPEPSALPAVPAPTIVLVPVPATAVSLSGVSAPRTASAVPIAEVSPPAPTEVLEQRSYLVPYGDTLANISRRFGVPIEDIMHANNIEDPNLILTGRTLVIPEPR